MADEGPPPRLRGQLDVFDCIRIAESNEDDLGLEPWQRRLLGELYPVGRPEPKPKPDPRPLTAAEVVALRLKEKE